MKKIKFIITIFLFIVFIYSLMNIFVWFKENKQTQEEIKIINDIETPTDKIDFTKLKENNNDTVAWLKVNGTNIDYPVVQTKDNQYYLKHSFNKKNNSAGWIFLDYRNNINNLNKNTIIYGHARLDKSMFGSLKNIFNKKWYKNKDNQIITLTTPQKEYHFQTFSTYYIKTEDYYITTQFNSDEEYNTFIKTLINRSTHNFNVDVNTNDLILTLSTCHNENQKTVLHAKLIKEDSN